MRAPASEAADAARDLLLHMTGWHGHATATAAPDVNVWFTPVVSREKVGTSFSRQYDQKIAGVKLGVDRRIGEDGDGTTRVGAVFTQAHAHVEYARGGGGAVNLSSLALNASYAAGNGAHLAVALTGSNLISSYNALNQENSASNGSFHVKALGASMDGGFPIPLGLGLALEPSAAAVVAVMFRSNDISSAGVSLDMDRKTVGTADLGVTLRHLGVGDAFSHEVYGRIARVHTFGDDLSIVADKDGGTISAVAAPGPRNGHEAVVGGSLGFGQARRLSVGLEAAHQRLSGSASGWSGIVSIVYGW